MADPVETGRPPTPAHPLDEHNRRLVGNVHPPEWVNPTAASRYHLVVLGAGTTGLVAAAGAAGLGARVALVERSLLGGDCLNVGCVPSKAIIRAARAWREARLAGERFGGPPAVGEGDFAAAMRRMRRLRARLSEHDSVQRFRALGVDVFLGDGRFVADDALEVAGQRLRFRRALIATGARAAIPPIPGIGRVSVLTNENVFTLTDLPRQLAVIGGGPIGCEMAQTFARFGSRVTLLGSADQLLPREDADAAGLVERALARDRVELLLGVRILEVGHEGHRIVVRYDWAGEVRRLAADALLVAAGRVPNVEDLGLETAGVAVGHHGVQVDDRLRTTNRRIFAAGDVASSLRFTHLADAQAQIVVQNALFFGRAKASDLVVPWCTYTSPEIAHVGLYERQAEERGIAVETLTVPLAEVDRAILDGADEGFLRLHLAKGRDRILGATLVAEHAGELLGEICLAVTAKIGLGRIAATIHPYPTQGEVIRRAANTWRRRKLTTPIKRLLALYFRMFS